VTSTVWWVERMMIGTPKTAHVQQMTNRSRAAGLLPEGGLSCPR